mgnify:CR=1 FL=1
MLKIRLCIYFLFVCICQTSVCVFASSALADTPAVSNSPVNVFENFWKEAKSNIYTKKTEEAFFTEINYQNLKKKAGVVNNIYELTPIINDFLQKMQISHTQFYDNHSIDFYMFRSMFLTRDISLPKVKHIGIQYTVIDSHYVAREVLDGYPAETVGIMRGDVLLEANGKPFHPYHSFNPNEKNIKLKILRDEKVFYKVIDAVNENPNLSYYNAMIQSKNTYKIGDKKIGYIHLWSGTHKNILNKFKNIIEDDFHDIDGIILDLRGGFGGTWYEYLDPFFSNRNNYFEYTWIDRNGKSVLNKPELKTNTTYFSGPMVVLINGGVRSGKEALAYQFKKSTRAILIGTNTMGAFSVGRGIFNNKHLPYFLYLATGELLLDRNRIEGISISPDIHVPYTLNENSEADPQIERAKLEIVKKIEEQN